MPIYWLHAADVGSKHGGQEFPCILLSAIKLPSGRDSCSWLVQLRRSGLNSAEESSASTTTDRACRVELT